MDVRTVGVEEELLIVDGLSSRPAAVGEAVVDAATSDGEATDEVLIEHEFKKEQAETGTAPATDLGDVRDQLVALRRRLSEAAHEHGAEIAALGTSPLKVRPTAVESERYRRMRSEYGSMSVTQLTCGQHVHVSVESREEGVAVLDRIRGRLAVLVALTANSPFWQGADSGTASYRTVNWGLWPSAGPTDLFGDVDGYDAAVDTLVATGAALDVGMVYFDARLSAAYPTVEIRVADVCQDVDDAVLVAALCRGLVETAARDWRDGVAPDPVPIRVLRAARWRAARYGLTGELVDVATRSLRPAREVVVALVDSVAPTLAGDVEVVGRLATRLLEGGTGADAQRRDYATGRLRGVVEGAVRRTLRS